MRSLCCGPTGRRGDKGNLDTNAALEIYVAGNHWRAVSAPAPPGFRSASVYVNRLVSFRRSGAPASRARCSNLNKKIYAKIEAWRNRRIEGEHPYVYLNGIVMKRSWAGGSATFHCWWPQPRPSIRKDFAKSWASARVPGRPIWLVGIFASIYRQRPQRPAAGHFRRLQRPCRERRDFLRRYSTLYGTILPQSMSSANFRPYARSKAWIEGFSSTHSTTG